MISDMELREHFNKICKELEVNPDLYVGNDFKEYITSPLGVYVWWNEENSVILTESADIQTLAHEIRHAWQYKNREQHNFKFRKDSSWLRRFLINLNFSRLELDAYRYAVRYCKKNKVPCFRSKVSAISPVLIVFGILILGTEILWMMYEINKTLIF